MKILFDNTFKKLNRIVDGGRILCWGTCCAPVGCIKNHRAPLITSFQEFLNIKVPNFWSKFILWKTQKSCNPPSKNRTKLEFKVYHDQTQQNIFHSFIIKFHTSKFFSQNKVINTVRNRLSA